MTQLFEVEGHPTVPTTTAPTIPAKLVDDFLPKARIRHPWPSERFAVRHSR